MLSKLELKVKEGIRNLSRNIRNIALTTISLSVLAAVSSATVYVNQNATGDGSGVSWDNACTTVQAGITNAATGEEVWVAQGQYHEYIMINNGAQMYGGFVGNETNKDQRNQRLNLSQILGGIGISNVGGIVVDSFQITQGNIRGILCSAPSGYIRNNEIFENEVGVEMRGQNLIFEYNVIHTNEVGIIISGGSAHIQNNLIRDNQNSGIHVSMAENVEIACNTIVSNGDGVSDYKYTPFMLYNCILWDNGVDLQLNYMRGSASYCCFGTISLGSHDDWEGNISTDPLLVNPTNGNYHLLSNSPCIDSGTNSGISTDLDGNPRPLGNGFDMGAYEFDPNTPVRRWKGY